MEKPDAHKTFWETYRAYSLLLLFPALLMFALSLMIYTGDDPEFYDRQTNGFVTSCTDVTRRSMARSENGGPILSFQIEADYEVDGVTYTCRETWGSPEKVGSVITISYNSAKPSASTMIEDPAGSKSRIGMLTVISGIALLFILFPLVTGKGRKPKDKQAKPEG
ncbi:MAG: DUF3592 domain-containing protein [Candidatus Ventricola sp.]